jgi:hypothetical protein
MFGWSVAGDYTLIEYITSGGIQNPIYREVSPSNQIVWSLDYSMFVPPPSGATGVQAIAPLISQFTVPKLDTRKIAQRTLRWQKIALSAAKQCGRTRIPAIRAICQFKELAQQPFSVTHPLLAVRQEDGCG